MQSLGWSGMVCLMYGQQVCSRDEIHAVTLLLGV